MELSTGTDSLKSNKHGQGSLARTLEFRLFVRWMSYIDSFLIIIGSAALVFGTLAFAAAINLRSSNMIMKDEAELDMESVKEWRLSDGNDTTIIRRCIHFDAMFSPKVLFGTVAFLYVTSCVLPLLAAFALHQSASEKPTYDLKTRIFLVKIWLAFNMVFMAMAVTAGFVVYIPEFLCLCLAIVGLRLIMTFFIIKYFAGLQDAAEEGPALQPFTNQIPTLVVDKK